MNQNDNKTTNNGTKRLDIDSKDYDPAKDPEVTDNYGEELIRWRDKLMPYQKYIMIIGFTILIILVVFLGYARGALDVCNDLGGRLEIDLMMPKCHPGSYEPQGINNVGQPFVIPNITLCVIFATQKLKLPMENKDEM